MPSTIKVLSEETINQIAAGEVIEHPASVVKELVENSLDAGSHQIIVEVLSGGFQLIRVVDDGCGMTQDDAILSLERHATSKVRKIEDLLYVSSMGFRGEALASIASISKLTMITSARADHVGVMIVSEGGKIKKVETCSRHQGTTLEIKSLFYTVPARKKFQKSPAQALTDIHKTLNVLALSRPDVAFRLISHEQCLMDTLSGSMKTRITEILGRDYLSGAMPLVYKNEWISIEGWIGAPTAARSNRAGQYIFINKRAVIAPTLSMAIADGYGTMLHQHKYPIFMLHITLNPELLDVNVHPQKKEVRFKSEGELKGALRQAVALALQGGEGMRPHVAYKEEHSSILFSEITHKKLQDVKEFCFQNVKTPEKLLPPVEEEMIPWTCQVLPQVEDLAIIGVYRHYLLLDGKSAEKIITPPYLKTPYTGILVLDLQKASARIYLEDVLSMQAQHKTLEMQTLLFPVTFSVSAAEERLLEEALPLMESLGVEMRPFGDKMWMIEACSSGLNEEDMQELVEDVLGELKERELSLQERKHALAMKVAQYMHCKKHVYSVEEAKNVVSALLKTEHPYFSPFGKKIVAHVRVDDEKFFSE